MAVPLVLLGALGLGLWKCSGTPVQRNRYNSLQDCERDYSTQQCTADYPVGSSGGGGSHYYGPWYRSRSGTSASYAGDPGPGRSGGIVGLGDGHPNGVELGTRGGFGASGRIAARGS